ncbi:uncharacterized protein TNCT_484971 [Trichonephila clavata]|uniref:Reverse transcriptase domain-containing protein n=1 Tax=Trichonephila clavata TaxID=2740835 RepID=A0A8X6L2L5_TRICU|nr:uncharacterized protein TNCT_484971 [Trichonephila clavata]
MEPIVSTRLMFHLESHNILSPLQSGFRKSRSTTDNLIRLETSIREAFDKKQYNISVFFDIKKAYDMSWRSLIKVVKEFKFLGLIFDQSLRFHRHLKYLKIRSAKALNILKILANTRWGANRTSLLRLYRALIRSKLDYGSVVYSSACKSLLKILDPVHHEGLRLCLGAFRTSPVESLYAEAYKPPLDLRRMYLWHAGITGNELADTATRSATGSSERFPIPHSDLKACFRQKLQSVWQSNWDQKTENKLHSVIPVLAPTVPSSSNRREQVIWTRLRLEHTLLTHRHLLFGEPPPYC